VRIALVGNGKMSRAIAALAEERGHVIATVIEAKENRNGVALTAERLNGIDLVFEFTRPEAAADNLLPLARLGQRVVSGTTGWSGRLAEVGRMVREHGGALLHSPNFSPGVHLFLRTARELSTRFKGRSGFEAFVTETHHAAKRDAPSGTAVALQRALREGDPDREFPVTSIRGGFAPGTHAVVYDAPFEIIRLEHQARSRQVFAAGALLAGEWLQGRTGIFTFEQMLFGEEP
jgi:4-hydroxy-tetrahydrodipicolinate reductase